MEKPKDIPGDRPLWTLFFEGTLYKRYQDYLRSHDLSKILDIPTYNSTTTDSEPPVLNDETDWMPPFDAKALGNGTAAVPHQMARITSQTSDKFLTDIEKKRRNKRTIGCIVLGFMCLGAVAAATALIMHFVFVEGSSKVSDSAPIRIPGSGTSHHNISGLDLGNGTLTRKVFVTTPSPRKNIDLSLLQNVRNIKNSITVKDGNRPDLILLSPTETEPPEPTEIRKIAVDEVRSPIKKPAIFKCKMEGITNWQKVFIVGKTPKKGNSVQLSFYLTYDGESTVKGNNSRIEIAHVLKGNIDNPESDDVELSVIYDWVECHDENEFSCGVIYNDGNTDENSAKLIVEVQPDDHVDITIPVQVIEGQLLKISASWKSGYPEPFGNLSWNKILPGETKLQSINGIEMSGTVKTNKELCQTIVDNFANFVPDLSWNGTEIIALPELHRVTEVTVNPGTEVLFVVPANHCDGFTNDTKIAHPYHCSKFAQCLPDRMRIYACPPNSCFSEDTKQCDEL